MSVPHWWCPYCGAFDGPITADKCDACLDDHDPGDAVRIEYLVPAASLGVFEDAALEAHRQLSRYYDKGPKQVSRALVTLERALGIEPYPTNAELL